MTELMFRLRRSPRTLLERDGHPGPGAGRLALVMARAGVGKTAFLVGIGVDALLSGQKVLHVSLDRTVEKVRGWYDDMLMEMLRQEKKLEHWAAIQLRMERHRHIQTFMGASFTPEKVRQTVELLGETMEFRPDVIIVDRMDLASVEPTDVAALRAAAEAGQAELWMACRTHRDGPEPRPGHLPAPADGFENLVDLAFSLDPHDAKVRLRVLKDDQRMLDQNLNVVLDTSTLLLMTGFAPRN